MRHDEYPNFLEREYVIIGDCIFDNSFKSRKQIDALKQVLKPAIEAAQSRIGANVQLKDDEALLEAGRILGVSDEQ